MTNKDLKLATIAVENLSDCFGLSEDEIIEIINDGLELKYKRNIPDNIIDIMDEIENNLR